ncbi:L-2-amino-thiazoline-4-carboxylic acid hydrolase [Desulfoluna butyratoxydans]|uniref:L-2-amino-thiazoline-4-carboxylic acid hydrolase n=1 Tax=Desulfoluna butyratoxydans TaxID=231438 RepID=A0A4U8YNL0_9BACT|nr:L-2-amino-thiazoline-4-carboxylic acid hydrolase [Desulfoluna butyratoxydans]VFQ42803.1 l-2-amino-thiazoline-4-carboxylic acid hydrolase [Desulfoluna butyratoxydans]
MNIEHMANYGNGLVDSLAGPEFQKIEKKMFCQILGVLRREVGIRGIPKVLYRWRDEVKHMKQADWLALEKRGAPRAVIESTFDFIALMKVLDERFGMEKARDLVTDIHERTEAALLKTGSAVNLFAVPVSDLKACDDSFRSFAEYTKAQVQAAVEEGLHHTEIIEDTKNALSFHIHFCVIHEVAKAYGNPAWSFPWCRIDNVVYPKMGDRLNFTFTRRGTLPTGSHTCDFRFERSNGYSCKGTEA